MTPGGGGLFSRQLLLTRPNTKRKGAPSGASGGGGVGRKEKEKKKKKKKGRRRKRREHFSLFPRLLPLLRGKITHSTEKGKKNSLPPSVLLRGGSCRYLLEKRRGGGREKKKRRRKRGKRASPLFRRRACFWLKGRRGQDRKKKRKERWVPGACSWFLLTPSLDRQREVEKKKGGKRKRSELRTHKNRGGHLLRHRGWGRKRKKKGGGKKSRAFVTSAPLSVYFFEKGGPTLETARGEKREGGGKSAAANVCSAATWKSPKKKRGSPTVGWNRTFYKGNFFSLEAREVSPAIKHKKKRGKVFS